MRTLEGRGGWNGEGADCEVTERLGYLSVCEGSGGLGLFFTETTTQDSSKSYKSSTYIVLLQVQSTEL